jgi:hypothetical protein
MTAVRVKQNNLSFEVFVPNSERAKSSDLHEKFQLLISEGKEAEKTWVLSDWIVCRINYHFRENKDTEYGDGGFEVSNIAPADVKYFFEKLDELCVSLGMKLSEQQ